MNTRIQADAARFTLAHLALCAAAIRLRPAAEIVRFGLAVLCFAHRAFCARLILRRPAADIVRPRVVRDDISQELRVLDLCN